MEPKPDPAASAITDFLNKRQGKFSKFEKKMFSKFFARKEEREDEPRQIHPLDEEIAKAHAAHIGRREKRKRK